MKCQKIIINIVQNTTGPKKALARKHARKDNGVLVFDSTVVAIPYVSLFIP